MTDERRRYDRQPGPFAGEWHEPSGSHPARISFLSPGGCFVDSAASPPADAPLSITVDFNGTRFTLPSEVTYRDHVQGFGVRFVRSENARALALVLGMAAPR